MTGYGNGFSMLDRLKELSQAGLGFRRLNLTHALLRSVVLTILFYRLPANQVKEYPDQKGSATLRGALAFPLSRLDPYLCRAAIGNITGNGESAVDFWDRYLRNPPPEINSPGDWYGSPEDYHCVRWVGYEGGLEIDQL